MIGGPAAVVGLPPLFAAGFGNTGMLFWGLAACALVLQPSWLMIGIAGVMMQVHNILDSCDGEMARLPELIVPFKRGVYEQVAAAFQGIAG